MKQKQQCAEGPGKWLRYTIHWVEEKLISSYRVSCLIGSAFLVLFHLEYGNSCSFSLFVTYYQCLNYVVRHTQVALIGISRHKLSSEGNAGFYEQQNTFIGLKLRNRCGTHQYSDRSVIREVRRIDFRTRTCACSVADANCGESS